MKELKILDLDYKTLQRLVNFSCYDTKSFNIIIKKFTISEIESKILFYTDLLRRGCGGLDENYCTPDEISEADITPILKFLVDLLEESEEEYKGDYAWFETAVGKTILDDICFTSWFRKHIFNSHMRYFNENPEVTVKYIE